MKRIMFSLISSGIITMVMHSNANAQVALNKAITAHDRYTTEKYNNHTPETSSVNNISFRTLNDFRKRFASVTNASWYGTDNGYIVEFTADSVKTKAAYGKKGKWFYTVQRYHEHKMPADIRARVKSIYFDYSITVVNEINVPEEENAIYIVSLQYNNEFKTVRVCGNDMDVIASFHS